MTGATFSLEEIEEATGAELVSPGKGPKVLSGVSTDSRTLSVGNLFIALRGPRFDGHDFLKRAFAQGAAGVLVDRWPLETKGGLTPVKGVRPHLILKVPDTLRGLGDLARFHRNRFRPEVIAITGSTGKTTTKGMAAHLLSEKRNLLAASGTQNNQIGVPLTLLRLEAEHQAVILELGTNQWGEIRRLTTLVQPTVGVITNIGPAHLEAFGDLQGVLRAKGELWEAMDPKGVLVLNGDDPLLRQAGKRLSQRLVWFGTDPTAQVRADRIVLEEWGSRCRINDSFEMRLSLPGRHNLMNALAALAVCSALGEEMASAAARLESIAPLPGRLAQVACNGFRVIDDTYNANPASLKAALEVLRNLECSGRRILAVGDMLELGKQAELLHAQAGRWAADSGVDLLIAVGPLARRLLSAAWEHGFPREHGWAFDTAQEAGEFLSHEVRSGDAVLLKGSRWMRMEQILGVLEPLSKPPAAALGSNASSARSKEETYHENRDTATTSDEAMRRISAQPFGLRRQAAISGVTPPRRTPGSTPSSSFLGSGRLALATRLTRGFETSS